jgi:hypothetical protein
VSGALFLFLVLLALLMFRDNLTPPESYQLRDIHNQYIRTYNEEVFDRLFEVFPGFAFLLGLLALPLFLRDRGNYRFSLVLLTVFLTHAYFLSDARNSPQLYWSLRRYLVLVALITLACAVFLRRLDRIAALLFGLVFALTATNQFYNSRQIPDYRGLDKSVSHIARTLSGKKPAVILFDEETKYLVSSVVAYGGFDILPLEEVPVGTNLEAVLGDRSVYLVASAEDEEKSPSVRRFRLEYEKMGENYDRLPEAGTRTQRLFFVKYEATLR